MTWHTKAACRGLDPEMFFPTRGQNLADIIAICERCSVRQECLDDALREEHDHDPVGVRDGLSAIQRRQIKIATPRAKPDHGTVALYRSGCRCEECLATGRAYKRQLRQKGA